MKINLSIHYDTTFGQTICVCGSWKSLGNWEVSNAARLSYEKNGRWSLSLDVAEDLQDLEYKYLLVEEDGRYSWEWGDVRSVKVGGYDVPVIHLHDQWRAPASHERVMFNSCFRDVLMRPDMGLKGDHANAQSCVEFRIAVPRIGPGLQICVVGNQEGLGDWKKGEPLLLGCGDDFPVWSGSVDRGALSFPVTYKYGIYDPRKGAVVGVEEGDERRIESRSDDDAEGRVVQTDESFRFPQGDWKGAGVAVPVFSLRSEKSAGIGDFGDLMDFVGWAGEVGMKMVQVLPLNDTIATHGWLDSYPYKSISVMALHPMYLNVHLLGELRDKKLRDGLLAELEALNAARHVQYPDVHRVKSRYFKCIFDQEGDRVLKSAAYKAFFAKNRDWLIPYAAYSYLRDKERTSDFREWGKYSTYDESAIGRLCSAKSEAWDDIAIHLFLQFHLDKQLRAVTEYARKNGIVLKGDIPIGISPNSVEAWTEPHLFHLDAQAGAPPDDLAVKGQNWGFPTYNWEAMAKEDYAWWKRRLRHMGSYFDAYRIDHILGFFRIWEIPCDSVDGVLGHFNAALPLSVEEIERFGISFDEDRMAKPYIREHLLRDLFGDATESVKSEFLEQSDSGHYRMKGPFDSQVKVNRHFLDGIEEEELSDGDRRIRDGLFALMANVLFVQTGENEWAPRITLHLTSSYAELDEATRGQLDALYVHFFYERHDDFWYQKALEKLPSIISASDMLVCGEDLGMVPGCVAPVMEQLDILSLEIQRMPKDPNVKYADPANAPYLSVCTTSTHDMPTIRGWWELERDSMRTFFSDELGNQGDPPYFAEPWVCSQMISQHLRSPAMWTVFPIQDLLAMDGDLRWDETHEEQINEPSNVRHRWKYRMHQSIEALKGATDFNAMLRAMIDDAGRNAAY